MYTAARPIMTTVLDVTSVVKTVPQGLFAQVWIATHHAVQTVKTRTPRHHRYPATVPHSTTPCVMLVASDITDKGYDIFS
jgi:hypothetical protein